MTTPIVVERDVPVPTKKPGRAAIYPFSKMKPGHSFAVSVEGDDPRRVLNRVNAAAQNWRRRHNPNAKFRIQTKGDKVRIWMLSI